MGSILIALSSRLFKNEDVAWFVGLTIWLAVAITAVALSIAPDVPETPMCAEAPTLCE